MDKTVAPSFDSDRSSLHSGNTMVTNVVQSFDQDSDKNSAHSGEITITNETRGYNKNMQSESLEVRGLTNNSYIDDDHSDTVDPANSITIIDRNSEVTNSIKNHDQNSFIQAKQVENTEKHNKNTMRIDEGGLWKANPRIRIAFTRLGLYLLKWDDINEKYDVRGKLFMVSYLCWFIWPMIGLMLAYFGSEFLGIGDITDGFQGEGQIMTSLTVYILMLLLTPALQTYAIRVFTENLPSILTEISQLSQDNNFFTYRLDSHEAKIKLFTRREAESKSKTHHVTRLPEFTFGFAVVAFLTSTGFSIYESTDRGSVFQEWYFLVMIAFYLFMPVFTTWFCIIFIEWHRKVYKKIHKEIGNTGAVGNTGVVLQLITNIHKSKYQKNMTNMTPENMINLGEYSDKIQDIFTQICDGVFKYALSVNMLVYLATSTYCTSRMLADPQYIYYIFPLIVSAGHIVLLCARCSELRKEYRNVLSKLKDIIHTLENENDKAKPNKNSKRLIKSLDLSITQLKDHSNKHLLNILHKLRENLLDSPPEVVILGSFTVDYGMLSTIIGFILSYALVINELFDESTPVCNVVDPSITTTTMSTAPIITGSTLPITTSTTDPINPSALSGGEIAGIVIGSVAGAALIGGVVFCYIKKKLCFTKQSSASP